MLISKTQAIEIIEELRGNVENSFQNRGEVLTNVIEALVVGPRILSPSELACSPQLGYELSSIYSGIREGVAEETLRKLRDGREEWWEEYRDILYEPQQGVRRWRIKILDATNHNRPKTRTVKIGYAHGVGGMKPGHALSMFSEVVGEGSWCLPLEIEVVPVGEHPSAFGAKQIAGYVEQRGWTPDEVALLDAAYTNANTLKPMHEAGANLFGRVSNRRVFYLPPPPYSGQGRPKVRGRKIKLSDSRTLPAVDEQERIELGDGRYCEISRYNDVRMKKWPEQPLFLYRVIEYKATGEQRYARPLWLIYIPANSQMPVPTPAEGQALYDLRFSVEHSIRFGKRELGLVSGQFNGSEAIEREKLWVELVSTAFWLLFALRALVQSQDLPWPKWWRSRKLTPGAVRRLALALFVIWGIAVPQPRKRGKSPGRSLGTRFEPRQRFRVFRKRNKRPAA
jgi:hypothetical protein